MNIICLSTKRELLTENVGQKPIVKCEEEALSQINQLENSAHRDMVLWSI